MADRYVTHWFASAVTATCLMWAASGCSAQDKPLAEAPSNIGYETVDAAMAGLRLKAGVVFSMENGWTIATDQAERAIWSFSPEYYPAYPAVVMRQAVPRGEQSTIVMSVHCEASKAACDDLVRTFAAMNGIPIPE